MKYMLAGVFILVVTGLDNPVWAQNCGASATPAAFGIYTPTSPVSTYTNATVTVTCTAPVQLLVSYTVTLSTGFGSLAQRTMMSGNNSLAYQLYKDAAHTQIWGDGTSGTSVVQAAYLLAAFIPVSISYTAHGQVAALQNVAAGTYGDTIMVTISY